MKKLKLKPILRTNNSTRDLEVEEPIQGDCESISLGSHYFKTDFMEGILS